MSGAVAVERIVRELGGRFSTELGIDVDAGDDEIERWFLAATLYGAPISVAAAQRTFRVLERAGIHSVAGAARRRREAVVALLDEGGYARYDVRTADLFCSLAAAVRARHGTVADLGRAAEDPAELRAALDALPGWGPVTVGLFLRELRGVWAGAAGPLDARAAAAGRRIGLFMERDDPVRAVARLAAEARCDPRDLEACLVRADLAARRAERAPRAIRVGG